LAGAPGALEIHGMGGIIGSGGDEIERSVGAVYDRTNFDEEF